MSDDKLSDFSVKQEANSIETCLVNVESSDEVIVILDKRYGPRLGSVGFENLSAVHLEYRRAVQKRKPIHVYVRDRLCADFSLWKQNGRDDAVELTWIQHERDRGLLVLLDEHSKLAAKASVTNWYTAFTNSIDLKAGMRKHLEAKVLPSRLVEAIQRNQFPMFEINVKTERQMLGQSVRLWFHVKVTNVGGSPAFNCRLFYEADGPDTDTATKSTIVAPGSSVVMGFGYRLDASLKCPEQRLIAHYESPVGVNVKDIFTVGGHIVPGPTQVLLSGGRLIERQFTRSPPVSLEISDL
jgi:hypothetical protein